MFHRLSKPLKSNSFFLFGARGTGKTTLLKHHLKASNNLWIDLLEPETEDLYARRPSQLKDQIDELGPEWVVLDEVQRAPKLLNIVHQVIESTKKKPVYFALSGSSARKLKRGSANLLAGRAFVYHLFPLTMHELETRFDLDFVLNYGSLPAVFSFDDDESVQKYLRAYALTYLREEIQMEQLVRKLDPFRNFLEIAASENGHIINFNRISRDVGVDIKTVQNYFQILEETWLGFFLPAYHRSIRKAQGTHPKFYFFDPGIKRALDRSLLSKLVEKSYAYGNAFEHWVILELYKLNHYLELDYRFYYLRTKDDVEIDLIIDRPSKPPILVGIKSTKSIEVSEVKKLARLAKEFKNSPTFYLSRDPHDQKIDHVHCLQWERGIHQIIGKRLNAKSIGN